MALRINIKGLSELDITNANIGSIANGVASITLPVSAIAGTPNQIDVTAGPSVTVSLDPVLVAPGSVNINAGSLSVGQSAAATSGVNKNSQLLNIVGNYWTGIASAVDTWTVQNVLNVGSANITATSVTGGRLLTVTCVNSFKIGNYVYLSGTAEAALNGQTVIIITRTATQFTANLTTGNFTNASDTGTAVLVNPSEILTLTHSGSAGLPSVQVPRISAVSGLVASCPSGANFPLTVTPTGGTGVVTWTYNVQGLDANGYAMSQIIGTTTTGVATLNGTTFNALSWTVSALADPQYRAASFNIYRTAVGTSPSTTGLIANVSGATTSYNDIGAAGDGMPIIAHEQGLTLYNFFQDRYNWTGIRIFFDNSGFGGWLLGTAGAGVGGAGGSFALQSNGHQWFIDASNNSGSAAAWCPGTNNLYDIGRFWNGALPNIANINLPRYILAGTALTAAFTALATVGANSSSGSLQCMGSYWTGAAPANDTWQWQNVLGTGANPTTALTLTHPTGTTGVKTVDMSSVSYKVLVATQAANTNSTAVASTAYADAVAPNVAAIWNFEDITPDAQGSSTTFAGANVVNVFRASISKRMSIAFLSFQITTAGAAGALVDFGLYNSAGTLIAHVGPQVATATGIFKVAVVGGPIQMQPGEFYFAATTNDATVQTTCGVLTRYSNLINAGATKYCGTATVSVGGALNATMGAISASTFNFPCFVLTST